jgi:excisionase family DNA binding protein
MGLVGTKEAAKKLKVSVRRVQAMIKQGVLPATKLARDWFIEESELARMTASERKPGRPRKPKK